MKKKYIFSSFIFILFFKCSLSQNLVPNWSFEDTVSCPSSLGQIYNSVNWSSYRESPDYFNSCAFPGGFANPSVPSNSWGYQYPNTGNAYAGITTFSKVNFNLREFIGIPLTQPLLIGQKYFASFFVSRASSNLNHMNIASNKIGLTLSTIPYSDINPAPINNFALIYNDSIIADTSNWIKISGSLIADSAYNYIIIGNFFTDSSTSYVQFDSIAGNAYYYIDDIRLSADSEYVNVITKYKPPDIVKIFPNPARDWIAVEGRNICQLSIYNSLGKLCFTSAGSSSSLFRLNISGLSEGIYFLSIKTNTESVNQKLIIN